MSSHDLKGIIGGVSFGLIGAYFLVGAFRLGIGHATNMGPGYFPMLFGGIMIGLALVLIVTSVRQSAEPIDPINWRPLISILGAIFSFAITFRFFGLVPAILSTVAVASFGDYRSRAFSVLVLSAAVAIGAWLIFRVGLGLPMPAFRFII
jgi:hypothetical protein